VTIKAENRKDHAQSFVAHVDGATNAAIPSIKGRVEGDAFILANVVMTSRRVDHPANN
jgi:hypothetical protein